MPRFEVTITLQQSHQFAVEADDPMDAQAKALSLMGERVAEHAEVEIVVDRGVS